MKISAVENMPTPQCKKDVQRFNGMVNYLGKFIPNLSEKLAPLRRLTEKKMEWEWNHEHESAWNDLKKQLTEEPVLRFYDPARPIKISSDASQSGLGAVLLQQYDDNWQPVAYASRSMTDPETRYAQIEKELLSITYACERFNQFVSGQEISVETDHKPLIALFQKPLNDCPLRIQRMMIRLQRYALNVAYTPGKMIYTADTLSRAVDPKAPVSTRTEKDVKAYVDMVTAALPVADAKLEIIRTETEKDETMSKLKKVIVNGWPNMKQDCSPDLSEYWNCRSELTVVEDIVYKGSKVVIPKSLRKEMLKKIQDGHLGIEKCKKRALCKLTTTTADAVISCMKSIFSRHGVPSEVFSDNGPQFANVKFKAFSKDWDFVHTTSSPHFPQSNGLVEKSVQTVKRLMYKAKDSGADFYRSLLAYRTMPLECGFSPAQLLMGRRLWTNLPIMENLLKTKEGEKVRKFKEQQKSKQKLYYDRGTRNLPELHPGDNVRQEMALFYEETAAIFL
ncbi:hypothetical protein SKAU_G00210870 [Synaphobranchus kaupii]|uniref:Integrase catalytic domain-containing protein n=1 Tax=Synaphobranchus kaupii TaxID=118154 RepID=A0A9Q1ISW5_SYNKA|nr:hypothetical protein SKAU_G00210870 [Synaphobranchus kaupii]